MSQIEQNFKYFLSKNPEVEDCYAKGLINRRALARHIVKLGIAKQNEIEAVIAMLRRYSFKAKDVQNEINVLRTSIKDNIIIASIDKTSENLTKIRTLMKTVHYETGETFKLVMGTSHLTLITDTKDLSEFNTDSIKESQSEISILFSMNARQTKGIVSYITKRLYMNDIIISEFLTATYELLIYIDEKSSVKAYSVIKSSLQK